MLLLGAGLLIALLVLFQSPDDTTEAPAPPTATARPGSSPPPPAPSGGSLHLALGNPSGATSSSAQPTNYLITRDQYALAYNRDRGIPAWASWHLDESDMGSVERYAGQFISDTSLPAGWYQVRHGDYSGSGYDRGHMVPSADRTASPEDNTATFILTNIVPQAPANNQGAWADLENHIRDLVRDGNEAYIIAGPQGQIDTLAGGALAVPAAVWKIAVVLPAGANDLARIDAETTVIAVLMPNDDSVEGQRWDAYLTSVGCIEALTGLNLLDALPDPVERALAGDACASGVAVQPGASAGDASQAALSTVIAEVEYNPPGDDLTGEYVLVQNTGTRGASLSGWTLEDEAGAVYDFPAITLAAGAELRVWVQAGTDDARNLYWGRTQPVWNNGGDTATLRDASGNEIDRFAYP
jgi:endonuclease G